MAQEENVLFIFGIRSEIVNSEDAPGDQKVDFSPCIQAGRACLRE